jgi:sugar/nucleoside kinase (ribokinase family)
MRSLLIVGGLTVDRFVDGSTAPGGSVLHSGLAAASEGASITTLTITGDEPEARIGLERLAAFGTVRHRSAPATTTYRHEEVDGRRVLVFEAAGGTLDRGAFDGLAAPDVALLAPIADELPGPLVSGLRSAVHPKLTVLLIQGWLRRLIRGEPVHPLGLDEVPDETWRAFASADAIVVSTEDLTEAPGDPFAQAAELRARLGARPILVLTLGQEGYLLDDPSADRVVASVPRRVVAGVPSVGAGDTFGAALALHLAASEDPSAAAAAATERVIAVLEARRHPDPSRRTSP